MLITVDENAVGGSVNVPVTVSHLPGAPTTFAVAASLARVRRGWFARRFAS